MSLSTDNDKRALTCVLCGLAPASTGQGDHIPPKNLYAKVERKAARFIFHTVPACVKCNGSGSRHDEALKLLMAFESGESRQRPREVMDGMARTIAKNQRLDRQVFSTASRIWAQRDSGIQLPAVAVSFDVESHKQAVARIARAMYWRITGNILPSSLMIDAMPLRQLDRSIVSGLQECAAAFPLTEANGGTLKGKLLNDADGTDLLVVQFFNKHTAVALIRTIPAVSGGKRQPSIHPINESRNLTSLKA